MTHTADVVIIGGGVNGISIAYALASRAISVVLVGKGALASGGPGRPGALGRAGSPASRPGAGLVAAPPVFAPSGFVNVVGPQSAENLRGTVEMLRGLGVSTT